MGFATGFTGGVTLTLTLAYLTVRAHERNREQQAQSLRYSTYLLRSVLDPVPEPLPPTRSEVAAAQRANSIEIAKDRWNQEVESAVRWVQHTDWDEVRETAEAGLANLWRGAFGEPAEQAEKAKDKLETAAQKAKAGAEEAKSGVAAAAKDAFEKAKSQSRSIESSAEDKAREARRATRQGVTKVEDATKDKADEAKGVIAAALEKGRGMAKDMVGKAKTTIGMAEDKVEAIVDGSALPPSDPVQKALHQRYERPESKNTQTVAEALRERYRPIDERDNTVLRGL